MWTRAETKLSNLPLADLKLMFPDVPAITSHHPHLKKPRPSAKLDLPSSFSWLEERPECHLPCEEQGSCGSCYAFASAAMLSERHCIKTGELVPLSVEYIISCDTLDFGCDGGHLQNTLTFLQDPVPSSGPQTYIGEVEDCS